ncbi:hypothetical protein ACFWB0_14160 [Rhodococcus sp. NPDC060086]|uniref:hypothetical protein n=1 Tax=unclassified Rhodococcus (in: high G+C Gram-positive bacteria) TaxID=192944 RepID=UPI0036484F78
MLGFGEVIDFRGHSDSVTLTVPVPDGLAPEALDTTVELPSNVARGSIDVESDGRLLSRLDLPPDSATVPLSIPLTGATVENQAAAVTLRLNLFAGDNICPEDWTTRSIAMRDGVVRYTGTATNPTVVADFLPPILERLDVYLPAEPSPLESDTAVGLAAAITTYHTGRPLAVDVRETPPNGIPPAAESPFVRQIVVTETDGADSGAEVAQIPGGPPALYLKGNTDSLATQARIATSTWSGLAVSSEVYANPRIIPPQQSPDITTLNDLGIGDQSATAVGVVQVEMYLDQARFGRPVGDLHLDLKGSYTPLPDTEGGLLTIETGDTVLDSWAAEPSGIIDRAITIPAEAMQRSTELTVTLRATGGERYCGTTQPATVMIDGDSHISSTTADPPVPDGFASLPQTLMPRFDIAATGTGIADTARAVDIVSGLQSLTPILLDTEWVTVDDALASPSPALIVSADGSLPDDLPLRLTETEDRRFEVVGAGGVSTSLTFGTNVTYASLQVIRDHGRTLLVATSTDAPAELDRTLSWLAAEPDRWPELAGHVLFTAEGRDPVALVDPRGDVLVPTEEGVSTTVRWILIGTGALVAAGIVAAVVLVALRRTRPRPR